MQSVLLGFILICLLDQLFMRLALVCYCYCGGMVCFLEGWNLIFVCFLDEVKFSNN